VCQKKNFKQAVKRNLLKRKIREQVISSNLYSSVSFGVSFFIIYNSKEILGSKEIKAALEVIAQRLALKN
jgi:ribonuclease P protein component